MSQRTAASVIVRTVFFNDTPHLPVCMLKLFQNSDGLVFFSFPLSLHVIPAVL